MVFETSGGRCSTNGRRSRLAGGEGVSVKPENDGGRLGDDDASREETGFVPCGDCGVVSGDHGPEPHNSGEDESEVGRKKFVSLSGLRGHRGSGLSVFFSPEIEFEINDSNLDAI